MLGFFVFIFSPLLAQIQINKWLSYYITPLYFKIKKKATQQLVGKYSVTFVTFYTNCLFYFYNQFLRKFEGY